MVTLNGGENDARLLRLLRCLVEPFEVLVDQRSASRATPEMPEGFEREDDRDSDREPGADEVLHDATDRDPGDQEHRSEPRALVIIVALEQLWHLEFPASWRHAALGLM